MKKYRKKGVRCKGTFFRILCILTHSYIAMKKFVLTMTDLLLLHAVLHDQKNYYLFRFKILIKLFAEMKSRGAEYFEINIECMLYIVCGRLHTYQTIKFNLKKLFSRQSCVTWLKVTSKISWSKNKESRSDVNYSPYFLYLCLTTHL